MILFLLYKYSNDILRKIYKVWLTSIDIIWEKREKEIEFSGKFIYPDTVIKDLAREEEVVIDVIEEEYAILSKT